MRSFISKSGWYAAIVVLGVGTLSRPTSAAVILQDNFDGYTSTSDMQSKWGSAGVGTLDTTKGNPGNSIAFANLGATAVTSNQRSISLTGPSDAQPIIWQFDFLDDGVGNKRLTGALRDVGGSGTGNQAFLEMGRFNSINDPESGTTISGYGMRTAFIGGPSANSGWIDFVGNPAAHAGWNRFTATIGATSITFTLDFDADGTIDASRTVTVSDGGKLYNLVRFGGPSDVSSAGGGGNFDNLSITTAPEPACFGLIAPAGMLALARRRRRRQPASANR